MLPAFEMREIDSVIGKWSKRIHFIRHYLSHQMRPPSPRFPVHVQQRDASRNKLMPLVNFQEIYDYGIGHCKLFPDPGGSVKL